MRLTPKLMILTFVVALLLSGGIVLIVERELKSHALNIARDKARMLLHDRLAINDYWSKVLRPKVFKLLDEYGVPNDYFDPVWMSATYANRYMAKNFRDEADFASYYYKNAAVNARSPENEANDYEQEFYFQLVDNPELTEWAGVKYLDEEPYYVMMVRNLDYNPLCMRCHSTPEEAPSALIERYGKERSFDKQVGRLSSVLSVRVPLQQAYAVGNRIATTLIGFLAALIFLVFSIQFILTRKIVVKPIQLLTDNARRIAENNDLVGETIEVNSSVELRELSEAFSNMSVALAEKRHTLELAVRHRTQELLETNRALAVQIEEREVAETMRRELELQLRQKYKLEAVGVLAGGIAHNFNNNLSIILGNIELAQYKIANPDEAIEFLDNSKAALLHSKELIKQILIYSQQNRHEKKPIQLFRIIKETLALIRSTIPSSVVLNQNICDKSLEAIVNADAPQIQEALLNLCNNSVHAMKETGELTISLKMVRLESDDIPAQYDCLPGEYAKLSVTDTGCGMSNETLEKIFDPFFTTKEVDQGTGMGLATVRGIVEQHRGIIKVESHVGIGTTVELYFPVSKPEQPKDTEQTPKLQTGSESVLFIDDDEMIAQLGKTMLDVMGYRTTYHTSALTALELIKQDPEMFDLVITDQTMPEMTGKQLAEQLHELNPELPVILCTGYSSKISEEDNLPPAVKAFCMKPLEMSELSTLIRDCLQK